MFSRILPRWTTWGSARFASAQPTAGRVITPAVRVLLDKTGISLNAITPTGPKGHILKGDVLRALSAQPPAAAKPVAGTLPSPSATSGNVKIAIPHVYLNDEVRIDSLLKYLDSLGGTSNIGTKTLYIVGR